MIVRISGEGQFRLPDEDADRLNELDNRAVSAVEQGDETGFQELWSQMLELVTGDGNAVDDDELVESDVILPPRDITFDEAKRRVHRRGPDPGLMDEEAFNLSVRRFLKKLGVTSQREIELAVREQLDAGGLSGDETLNARAVVTVEGVEREIVVTGEIALSGEPSGTQVAGSPPLGAGNPPSCAVSVSSHSPCSSRCPQPRVRRPSGRRPTRTATALPRRRPARSGTRSTTAA